MILVISGDIGSGKTTLARELAKELGYNYRYTGGIFREYAAKEGKTLEEFDKAIVHDPERERAIDDEMKKFMLEGDNRIAEGRMAPFFPTPEGIKRINLFLKASEGVAVKRKAAEIESQGGWADQKIIAKEIQERKRYAGDRYRKLYGIEDYLDPSHFDYIVDTSDLSREETYQKVKELIKPYL